MKRFLKCMVAIIAAAAAINMFSFVPTKAASKTTVSADTKNIYFSNTIPSASAGSSIVNCLGYFVTISSQDGTEIGTVFVSGDTLTGRSYYSPYDRTTGKLISANGKHAMETRIPIQDIVEAFQSEYGKTNADLVNDILQKKEYGSCKINSMVCCAALAGNKINNQAGWDLHTAVDGATFPDIAYTQVKLLNRKTSYKRLLGDLQTLNAHPAFADAIAQKYSCIAVNPAGCICGDQTASVLCVSDGVANKNFSNLTPEKTFKGDYASLVGSIKDGYFGIPVALKEVPPGPPEVGTVSYTVSDNDNGYANAVLKAQTKQIGTMGSNSFIVIPLGIIVTGIMLSMFIICGKLGNKEKKNKDDNDTKALK